MGGWFWLIGAITTEVAGTTAMKLSGGFSRFWPSVFIFIFYGVSLALLTKALKHMELGKAYAVWSALGTGLVAVIGIIYFREPLTLIKAGSLILIMVGVAGLHISAR